MPRFWVDGCRIPMPTVEQQMIVEEAWTVDFEPEPGSR